ncbi:peptide ABC transporter substrate-binding protein [Maritalea mediterranea]|uniref:Peptide ABC transporter substrate-binding protein n=1 Tax=Maritalea mediterranea TaxID=2909667 RepID=A0ABS9E3V2_9HYPH|nr:peptide ABC transporter substrate-binding protein [Maritalea mediterranea]MCF4097549.1 peptide ABC transporter substrate-binding protein [Maritalea mediterranea]
MRKLKTLIMATAAASTFATAALAERGSDGNLNIAYWQAVSILNPYLSGGTKDIEASSLILDPLANYRPDGSMEPALATEIPTIENGGVSEDLKSITWKLRDDVVWSDGTPFTAADVVFSANYCLHPEGGCNAASNFADVESVEAVDDHTVKINFSVAKPFPYGPFVGATAPVIQEAQFKDCMGAKAPECTDANFGPIGTGPFVVDEFRANDVVTYKANENYRDPAQPAFATVVLKGGGDSASTTRSVLETGEFDYAWNVQVEPEVLAQMQAAGNGEIIAAFGTSVERLMVNLTNPDPALGDKRSTVEGGPHPFLSDKAVRQALSMAIDRDILVEVGYGPNGQVTCNVLPAPEIYASTANDACKTQDIEGANKLLDEAGWMPGPDGIREKDGVRLSILYQTSTNSVRQGTQALVKQMWQEIGVETELRNIDAGVFFGGDQSSPDTFQKFFADIEMYTNNFDGTDPEAYMGNWVCSEIPSPANQWIGNNMPRFCSEEYDALSKEMGKTASIEKRAELAKKMNDMLMQEYVMIPLIHRGRVSAKSNALGNVTLNPWDSELAFAEEWTRVE